MEGAGGGFADLAVADQQDGVVDGDAEHGHAEAQGDAVDEAEDGLGLTRAATAMLAVMGAAMAASTARERKRQ